MWNRSLRIAARSAASASILALLVGQAPAWAGADDVTVESGRMRGDVPAGEVCDDGNSASAARDKGHKRRSKTHGANTTWCGVADEDARCGSGADEGAAQRDKGHKRRSKTHGANTTWCGVADESEERKLKHKKSSVDPSDPYE